MAVLKLEQYGITGATEIIHNPSYEFLFEEEMKSGLEGYEKGQLTELDSVNVMTGVYTGRSPKDKYIVMDKNSKDTVWWTTPEYPNDNHVMSEEVWAKVKALAVKAWRCVSLWKWPGRLTLLRICLLPLRKRNRKTSNRIL